MGHVDERESDALLDVLELDLHRLAELQVEGAQRLVEQEHTGAVHERTRQRDPLPLAARQLARLALPELGQPHHLECVGDRSTALAIAAPS